MGMSIFIEKEQEDANFVIYKFGLNPNDTNKLKLNKTSLEFEKLDSQDDSWNYIFFKAGSYIKKQYLEKGIFPDKITCAS